MYSPDRHCRQCGFVSCQWKWEVKKEAQRKLLHAFFSAAELFKKCGSLRKVKLNSNKLPLSTHLISFRRLRQESEHFMTHFRNLLLIPIPIQSQARAFAKQKNNSIGRIKNARRSRGNANTVPPEEDYASCCTNTARLRK